MPPSSAVATAVRTCLRALITGDHALLATVALPHPELATLVPNRQAPAAVAPQLAALDRLDLHVEELPDDRLLVRAALGGLLQLLVVQETPQGPRIDLSFPIAALTPDDERRRVARAFYLALLLGDAAALRALAFDERGLELLAEHRPPAGEHDQLAHVAATMALVELQVGEPFAVANGVQFVSTRHAELGIVVLAGLTPQGVIPFLLRQREGAWKVIPFHFLQAAALARGATLQP